MMTMDIRPNICNHRLFEEWKHYDGQVKNKEILEKQFIVQMCADKLFFAINRTENMTENV